MVEGIEDGVIELGQDSNGIEEPYVHVVWGHYRRAANTELGIL